MLFLVRMTPPEQLSSLSTPHRSGSGTLQPVASIVVSSLKTCGTHLERYVRLVVSCDCLMTGLISFCLWEILGRSGHSDTQYPLGRP